MACIKSHDHDLMIIGHDFVMSSLCESYRKIINFENTADDISQGPHSSGSPDVFIARESCTRPGAWTLTNVNSRLCPATATTLIDVWWCRFMYASSTDAGTRRRTCVPSIQPGKMLGKHCCLVLQMVINCTEGYFILISSQARI